MKLYFSDEQKENYINHIELEDLTFYVDYIEGEGVEFVAVGKAIVDDEVYNDFIVEFEIADQIEDATVEDLIMAEWENYNYKF